MTTYYSDDQVTLHLGNALDVARDLADGSSDCIVTSPPYLGLRDYGVPGTDWPAVTYAPMADMPEIVVPAMTCPLGLEPSPTAYVAHLVLLFRELRRVLADDGCMFINIGDSYVGKPPGNVRGVSDRSGLNGAQTSEKYRDTLTRGMGTKVDTTGFGIPPKNLLGVPWRVAFALQADGWILRNSVVWYAPNKMPESVTDRLSTKHEMVFMFSKRARYWFDLDAIREPHVAPPKGGLFKRSSDSYVSQSTGTTQGKWDGEYNTAGRNPGDYWEFDHEPIELPAKRLSEEEAAYIAAFIDGEGSICIRRRKRQIQLILCVVNTHEGIIRWLHERTGMGQIVQREIRNEKWRQVWEWNCSSRQAAQVIYAIYPYLRMKRQQAAVALHFMETTRKAGGGAASAAYHERRHRMAEDLSALNAGTIAESKFAVDPAPPLRSSAGDVFVVNTQPFAAAHFAVMPRTLAERCIQAGCTPRRCTVCGHAPTKITEAGDLIRTPQPTQRQSGHVDTAATARSYVGETGSRGMPQRERAVTGWTDCGHDAYRAGIVLDPFSGSGTTGLAAARHGRRYVGIDLNREYLDLSLTHRLQNGTLDFTEGTA